MAREGDQSGYQTRSSVEFASTREAELPVPVSSFQESKMD